MKKYLPTKLEECNEDQKKLVYYGALRDYLQTFYKIGMSKITDKFNMDNGKIGRSYISGKLFKGFAGENYKLFEECTNSKYKNLKLLNLAYYAEYIRTFYVKCYFFTRKNDLTMYQLDKIIDSHIVEFKDRYPSLNVIPCKNVAKESFDKNAKMIYDSVKDDYFNIECELNEYLKGELEKNKKFGEYSLHFNLTDFDSNTFEDIEFKTKTNKVEQYEISRKYPVKNYTDDYAIFDDDETVYEEK